MINLKVHQIIRPQRISCLNKSKNNKMLSRNIRFKGFQKKKHKKNLKGFFQDLIRKSNKKNNLINSFSKSYKFSFNKNLIKKYKRFKSYQIYGMGGSSLGSKAIYDFIGSKNKNKFFFF